MGFSQALRQLVDWARGKVRPQQAESGIDKVGDRFDEATGGKYAARVDQAQQKAKDAARKHLREDT